MVTQFRRNHVCLRSQVGNSVPIAGSMTACGYLIGRFVNFSTLSKLLLLISVQKLTQVIKSKTAKEYQETAGK